ncbi:unnamed protein product [Ilex paraguariensis]|uniref:Uncharacterized protein n=1 Tax=Ilex paraguariensis TaxID=185542 RepID=A0ABC8V4L4_9AQUA
MRDDNFANNRKGGSASLLNSNDFKGQIKESGIVYVLVGKEEQQSQMVPKCVRELVDEYRVVMPKDLPNLPHCHMSLKGHEELESAVDRSTGKSPSQRVYGRNPNQAVDILYVSIQPQASDDAIDSRIGSKENGGYEPVQQRAC